MHQTISGIYVVLAELPNTTDIRIGKKNPCCFKAGIYGYVGSAMNGLKKRLVRHFSNRKRLHWHIDYLLDVAIVLTAIYAETGKKVECQVAKALSERFTSKPNFGCSDCNCSSHLFFSPKYVDLDNAVLETFKRLGLNPLKIINTTDLRELK